MEQVSLIPCESCGTEISPDAASCPKCGADNTWIHPTLKHAIAHLEQLPRLTEYEVLGHRMVLEVCHQNTRQRIGWFLAKASMVCLIPGLWIGSLMTLALLLLLVSMLLLGFGLSGQSYYELTIDLRKPGKTVGYYDRHFWADVISILNKSQPQQ